MTRSTYVIILLLLFIFISCKNKNDLNKENILSFDTKNWKVDNEISLSNIKDIKLLPLGTSDSCLIGDVDKIVCTTKYYFIADNMFSKKIFVFDKDGKYLYSIGKYGRGPGEYIFFADFLVDEDKNLVYVLDRESRKLIIYDSNDGGFIKDINLNFHANNFAMITSELFIFWAKSPNEKNKIASPLIYYNVLNGAIKEFLKYDEYDTPISEKYTIFNSSKILYSSYLKDVVYEIAVDRVAPYIKFDFGDNLIPRNKIKNAKSKAIIELLSNRNYQWSYNTTNFLENSDFLTFNLIAKNRRVNVIYSKSSGNYLYGKSYDGLLKLMGTISNIAVDGENFISVVDSRRLNALFTYAQKNNYDTKLIKNWSIIDSSLIRNSNPILVLTKYKSF